MYRWKVTVLPAGTDGELTAKVAVPAAVRFTFAASEREPEKTGDDACATPVTLAVPAQPCVPLSNEYCAASPVTVTVPAASFHEYIGVQLAPKTPTLTVYVPWAEGAVNA